MGKAYQPPTGTLQGPPMRRNPKALGDPNTPGPKGRLKEREGRGAKILPGRAKIAKRGSDHKNDPNTPFSGRVILQAKFC